MDQFVLAVAAAFGGIFKEIWEKSNKQYERNRKYLKKVENLLML